MATVDQTMNPTLNHTILVTQHGLTLYYLTGESAGHLLCTSAACLKLWPPLLVPSGVSRPSAGTGISMAKLGTVDRPGGRLQVTYNGRPLYLYAGDSAAGQANGNKITVSPGHTWLVITTGGSSSGGATSSSTTAPPASSGGSSSSGGSWG